METKTLVAIGIGAAVLLYLFKKQAAAAVAAVGNAVNPTSQTNVANVGVNALVNAIANPSGAANKDTSLGSEIYDMLHTAYDPNVTSAQDVPNSMGVSSGSW